MSVVVILVIIGVIVAGGFLGAFIWSVKSGQYDDTYSPAVRILFDDAKPVESEYDIRNSDKKNREPEAGQDSEEKQNI